MYNTFSNNVLTFNEKVLSSFSMVQRTIVGIDLTVINSKCLWLNLTSRISYIGIDITVVSIIEFFVHRKELMAKMSMVWVMFYLVLFTFLNWIPHESPLFNIYFAWAYIVLFVYGIDYLFEKFKLNKQVSYNLLYIAFTLVNIGCI